MLLCKALLTTARIAAFIPGESPPDVNIPIFLIILTFLILSYHAIKCLLKCFFDYLRRVDMAVHNQQYAQSFASLLLKKFFLFDRSHNVVLMSQSSHCL